MDKYEGWPARNWPRAGTRSDRFARAQCAGRDFDRRPIINRYPIKDKISFLDISYGYLARISMDLNR